MRRGIFEGPEGGTGGIVMILVGYVFWALSELPVSLHYLQCPDIEEVQTMLSMDGVEHAMPLVTGPSHSPTTFTESHSLEVEGRPSSLSCSSCSIATLHPLSPLTPPCPPEAYVFKARRDTAHPHCIHRHHCGEHEMRRRLFHRNGKRGKEVGWGIKVIVGRI